MKPLKPSKPLWWGLGLFMLTPLIPLGFILSKAARISRQYTLPGITDYRNGNYTKAIQELNTSISLSPGDSYAYYYLGLSLRKTGDNFQARRAFLNAKSCESNSRTVNEDFIERCNKAIAEIDDKQ